jgi:hypothetical protein
MKYILTTIIVGLIGFGIGRAMPATSLEDIDSDLTAILQNSLSSEHGTFEADSETAPTVSLAMHEDSASGWNAEIKTTNFNFAPEHAGGNHVDNEGHAHIYVDGVKINRVYGNWYHLESLATGEHDIEVRLSTNDHKEYVIEENHIAAQATITVTKKETMKAEKTEKKEEQDETMMEKE